MFDDNKIESELRKKIRSFEVSPPDDLWNDIEKSLQSNKRKGLFIIISYASAAAFALLFVAGGLFFLNDSKNRDEQITIVESNKINKPLTDSSTFTKINAANDTFDEQLIPSRQIVAIVNANTDQDSSSLDIQNTGKTSIQELKAIQAQIVHGIGIIPDKVDLNISHISRNEQIAILEMPVNVNQNWNVNVSGYPVYSFHTNGLKNTQGFADERGIVNWGAAVSVSKALYKNYKLEVGLSYNPYGQQVDNIYFVTNSSSDLQVTRYPGLETSLGYLSVPLGSNSKVMDIQVVDRLETDVFNATSFKRVYAYQVLGYLEFPVKVAKEFYIRQYGITCKGGITPSFLVNNSMQVVGSDFNIRGKTIGADKVGLSVETSIGLSIPVTNKVVLTIDPTIKYSLMPYKTNLGKTHPFSTFIRFGIEVPIGK